MATAMATEVAALRRRNEELEREVGEARAEVERARARARVAEEAEERLCAELGEIEAEGAAAAREYRAHLRALADELALARALLSSSSSAAAAAAMARC
ncbi:protein RESPONSE TO LOW SULFUR 2-like [Ananas comosus]|uniref:Protein RESPONSE TO LOW SULFUR 2-like n=1 Tax=Ananas comosus TaxID=4615 RepID=A0A6P5EIC1_ANACO|nr:protein RESPONSE TO LOW SULFUR 2-like [Ananas comosus]